MLTKDEYLTTLVRVYYQTRGKVSIVRFLHTAKLVLVKVIPCSVMVKTKA